MILTCPSCGTQYAVKDGAIPPDGRQVRCAACKHSWHQNPEETETVEPQPADDPQPDAPSEPAAGGDESVAEATLIEPRSGPEAEERAYEAAVGAENEVVDAESRTEVPLAEESTAEETAPAASEVESPPAEAPDDEFTFFPSPEEAHERKHGPFIAVLVVILAVIIIAAAFWFLAPAELNARLGLGGSGATPLALVTTHMDRQKLESGNELLTVTGRVINPTPKEQYVPTLQAQLKTKAGKIVYSWTIAPPARSLPPGSSASFNSAEVNVPPGGDELTITLGTPSV